MNKPMARPETGGVPSRERRSIRPQPLGADVAYTAEQIQVLEGLEAVRRRPGMYIGSTDSAGLHHLVYEIVDNSVDEALAGYCDHDHRSRIGADGACHRRGQRPRHPGRHAPARQAKSALEVVMTVLHAGGKFGGGGYKVSGGLHGVGRLGRQRALRVVQGRGRTRRQGLPPGVRARRAHGPGQGGRQRPSRPRHDHHVLARPEIFIDGPTTTST